MNEAIAKEIREFIVTNFMFGQESQPFTAEQSFLQTGIIDSTGLLELVAFLEHTYDLSVADHELVPENLDSLANVSTFVASKLAMEQPKEVG
jgi:acyl carrier protein